MKRKLLIPVALFCLAAVAGAQPVKATQEHREIIKRHIYGDYKKMLKQPTGIALKYPYLTPGSQQYARVLWDWDSWLSDVALRQTLADVGTDSDREEALVYEQGCVLNYLAYTSVEDGYMPMVISAGSDPNKIKPADIYATNMHKPCLAQHAAFLVQQTGSGAEWLREGYPRLEAFIKNYHDHHRHAETGLYYWQDDLAIGVDNDPSTFFRPKGSSASIYLNCLMYKELRAMSYLAAQLALPEAEAKYTAMADSLRDAVREWCWDEKDGMYYSVDLNLVPFTGEPQYIFGTQMVLHKGAPRSWPCLIQRIGCWSGFMTMWAGIATPEQARRMVKENLLDERTYGGTYGVRTLSKLEKMYNLRATNNPSNWLGPLWGVSNYMVFRGLADYGLNEEARMMAEKTVALFGEDLKQNGALHEYYDPDTGRPIMNPGFQNWNYLVLNMVAWLEDRKVVREFYTEQCPTHLRTELAEHTDLTYEGQSLRVRTAQPRFSWVVPSSGNGTMQTAYCIQVATSAGKLTDGKPDLWDSRRVDSGQSVSIAYGGKRLRPATRYFWRVKTWDSHGQVSGWSGIKSFWTADVLDGGMAHYPLTKTTQSPISTLRGEGYVMYDFGRDAFAQLTIHLDGEPQEGDTLTVHLGERSLDKRVDRTPGGSIRYSCYQLPLHPGQQTYHLALRPDKRNTTPGRNESGVNPILMPAHIGEVTPFRYCEIEKAPAAIRVERQMVHEPFEDAASGFHSSDTVLNKVWELCKYSMKATSFCGVYVDGDRERLPYEADVYVNQLSHYAVDGEYTMARGSAAHVTLNPTWPTEWILLTPVIAWNDYLYTGDDALLRRHFKDFQAKTLYVLTDTTGLISTKTERVTPGVYEAIHFKGKRLRDIVDWPQTGAAGIEKENGGEADGYERSVYNSAVNAYHYRSLCAVRDMAAALGEEKIRRIYAERAEQHLRRFNDTFFDPVVNRYIDAIGHPHASQHANMFPLAFGMVPPEQVPAVAAFLKSRGMACSVYGAQFLLDALYEAGESEAALQLLTSTSRRSWYNMLRIGSTITTEAWDDIYKPNQDWNHAWGAAAANIIARRLMGVEPLEPGFSRIQIKPQPGSLAEASIRVPTIRGTVSVAYRTGELDVEIPANSEAEVWLPWNGERKIVQGGRYHFTK